jgi:hypothetical protein
LVSFSATGAAVAVASAATAVSLTALALALGLAPGRAFDKVKYEVDRKVRRLAAKKCKRRGFGWKRWSSAVVYGTWGLFRDYRVVYWSAKACPG